MPNPRSLCLPTLVLSLAFAAPACADEFYLAGGGQVSGQLLNASQDPRTTYQVRTDSGLLLALNEKQVRRFVPTSDARRQYETLLPRVRDTAEGNWMMSQWCRDQGLSDEREFHLNEVLRHDSDHREARLALGYTTLDGKWVQTDEWNRRHGYVYHQGKWMTPQEVESQTAAQRIDDMQRTWKPLLHRLRSAMVKRNASPQDVRDAAADVRAIKDPLAGEALAEMYEDEDHPDPRAREQLRMLWVETLGKNPSSAAVSAVVKAAIEDESDKVREAARDALEASKDRRAVGVLLAELKSKDNARVNRAGAALERIADPETIVPLMDALVTEHKFILSEGRPGSTSATFSPQGGSGFSAGNKTKVVTRNVNNTSVRNALVHIVKEQYNLYPGIQFDKEAWKSWYAELNAPEEVSFRRDR